MAFQQPLRSIHLFFVPKSMKMGMRGVGGELNLERLLPHPQLARCLLQLRYAPPRLLVHLGTAFQAGGNRMRVWENGERLVYDMLAQGHFGRMYTHKS